MMRVAMVIRAMFTMVLMFISMMTMTVLLMAAPPPRVTPETMTL